MQPKTSELLPNFCQHFSNTAGARLLRAGGAESILEDLDLDAEDAEDRSDPKSGLASSHFFCKIWQHFENISDFFSKIHWPLAYIWNFPQTLQNFVKICAEDNRFS